MSNEMPPWPCGLCKSPVPMNQLFKVRIEPVTGGEVRHGLVCSSCIESSDWGKLPEFSYDPNQPFVPKYGEDMKYGVPKLGDVGSSPKKPGE